MNAKIDKIDDTIKELKKENEDLKQRNEELMKTNLQITRRLDNLEAHSRRNNLLFQGISGSNQERWEESERKVREFICKQLEIQEGNDIEIERAHKLNNRGAGGSKPIIVKFTRYKDAQSVLQKCKEKLNRNSGFAVHQDFTEKVRSERRELSKCMAEAREKGQYATLGMTSL